ncbi:MAG: cysteine hydrolase [Oscillospiraceae bacterium]|nr:cysteine hydrolase [Oscillospiraceae bacterium]
MSRILIVVDMQNDFVDGSLGSPMAQAIVEKVKAKIAEYQKKSGAVIIFTRDTHQENYLDTLEGKFLPVKHCIAGTAGHDIISELDTGGYVIFDKPNFGSIGLADMLKQYNPTEIELCGLCTDICVVSNALILKARFPETRIIVDASCCAGVSEESHNAALLTMKMCQVEIIN